LHVVLYTVVHIGLVNISKAAIRLKPVFPCSVV
jgi:hypothetical protein